MIKKVSSMMQK